MTALLLAALFGVAAGGIQGTVDAADSNAPVAGARVVLEATGRVAMTDSAGSFVIDDVPAGDWWLRVEAAGFRHARIRVAVPATGRVRIRVALDRLPPVDALTGRVVDEAGESVTGATVAAVGAEREVITDAAGRFVLQDTGGAVRVRVDRLGYQPVDTTVVAGASEVVLVLRTQAVALRPLTVRSASQAGEAADRALFDREPRTGLVGVSRREIQEVPQAVERDVLRSLQALPGVVQLNDLSAQLHVLGGGPDQNLFLLDGGRVFAPYHLFGMFGALHPDAIERVEFYRGALPASRGGALSSVVEMRQVAPDTAFGALGIGVLTARAIGAGPLPGDGHWLLAARRSVHELMDPLQAGRFPFAFHEIHGRVDIAPAADHRVGVSFLDTADRYRPFLDDDGTQLFARWRNRMVSLRWDADLGAGWSLSTTAAASGYKVRLDLGSGDRPPTLGDTIGLGTFRVEALRQGVHTGGRFGVEVESGAVALVGSDRPGGYLEGAARGRYSTTALFGELERWVGAVRLAPGLRLVHDHGGRFLPEPRVSARYYLTPDVSITAGAGRSHQLLSGLRDDRYPLPGPPFWYLHDTDAPVSMADGLTAAVDGWIGHTWSVTASGYLRGFRNLPRWMPEGERTLDQLTFDDATATGMELLGRRHAGRIRGWVGLGVARVVRSGDAGEHFAAWDRRYAADMSLFVDVVPWLTISGRAAYGSGTPYWPQVGTRAAKWISPWQGTVGDREEFPIWNDQQWRLPAYVRLDLGARSTFRLGPAAVDFQASLLNLTARPNVLYYEYRALTEPGRGVLSLDPRGRLHPVTQLPTPLLPSLSLDVRF